ncbi:MAG TPA: recombinase family protein [bacterium]|nr:recombinase family protein [bacterium]
MKAALYVRVSTADQVEKWSLPAQKRALVELAERQQWAYEVYEDAGISGETLDARPAMLRLLEDARAGRIQVAVAVEMERFSRSESLFDWLMIKQAFRQGKVRFGTPQQLYDPADAEDDFLTDLFGALAKREKRKILERTRRGRLEAARQGRFVGMRIPIGYRLASPGVLEVDERGACIVRLIFNLALLSNSTRAIARDLLRRGIASPLGVRTWTHSEVCRVLRNPAYVGRMRFNRRRVIRADAGRRLAPTPEHEWIEIAIPPLISDETFRRVADQLGRNTLFSPRRRKATYLVASLIRCGACGAAMSGSSSDGRGYYRCNNAIDPAPGRERCRLRAVRANALDGTVWSQVVAVLRQPDVVLDAARRYRESHLGQRAEFLMRLETLRTELARVPEERERVQRLFREGLASFEETKGHLAEIDRKRTALHQEKETLEARLSMQTVNEAEADRLGRVIRRVANKLEQLSPEQRIEVIRAFVRRVVVLPGPEIQVHAFVPLPGYQEASAQYVGATWEAALS